MSGAPLASETPITLTPASADDVAAALRDATAAHQRVLIRGAGTKHDWGREIDRPDVVLGMRAMNRVLAHEHGDMTATIEAGASLADVNRALGRYGQWLPLDPAFAGAATIGGVLATNDSGALRHRFGTPRDLVIGVRLATPDGTLAKAGGQVVKNVAGYDLSKLVAGSFGSLAAIVSATFKLSPIPKVSRTLVLLPPTASDLARVVTATMASQLEPMAFDIGFRTGAVKGHERQQVRQPQSRGVDDSQQDLSASGIVGDSSRDARAGAYVLLRFASLAAVVDAQIAEAAALLARDGIASATADGDREEQIWREHGGAVWSDAQAAVVRASWLPANAATVIDLVAACGREAGVAEAVRLVGRVAVGAGFIAISGTIDGQRRAIDRLRASDALGHVVVVRAAAALRSTVDVWGPDEGRGRVLQAVKRAFDPDGVLVGRGPV